MNAQSLSPSDLSAIAKILSCDSASFSAESLAKILGDGILAKKDVRAISQDILALLPLPMQTGSRLADIEKWTGGVLMQMGSSSGSKSPIAVDRLYEALQKVAGQARLPDYISFNASLGSIAGVTLQVTLDRNGRVYVSPLTGIAVGKTVSLLSLSLTGGWLTQMDMPTVEKLQSFLSEQSFSILVGDGVAAGGTWVPGEGSATEIGIATPQIGGAYHYSFETADTEVQWGDE